MVFVGAQNSQISNGIEQSALQKRKAELVQGYEEEWMWGTNSLIKDKKQPLLLCFCTTCLQVPLGM